MKTTKENSEEYVWGANCLGWHLVNSQELSVIQELMPPRTSEVRHKHLYSQQFFFVLKGEATFELGGQLHTLQENQGIHVQKNQAHQIKNETNLDLEFLVISQPHSHNDKVIL